MTTEHTGGGSLAEQRRAAQLRWMLIVTGALLGVALVVTLLLSAPTFVVGAVAGLLVLVGCSAALLRWGKPSLAAWVYLVGWLALLLGSNVPTAADPAALLVVPYLMLPALLIASMTIHPTASLVVLAVSVVLYLVLIAMRGGAAILDQPVTPYDDSLYLVMVFYGGLILSVLSWVSARDMWLAIDRADANARALNEEVAAMERMVTESVVAATRVAGLSRAISTRMGEINAGAGAIVSASDGVARGARTQAEEAGLISRSVTTLARGTEEIAEASQEVSAAVTEEQALAEGAAITLADLRRELSAIERVVAIVNKVADRTQLVAINAAIEASRSGEAGIGFGVVAEEVQHLAEQSAASAREIGVISTSVRKRLHPVVEAMADVQEGTGRSGDLVADVVAKTREQAVASRAALGAADRIVEEAQRNAVATEGIAISAARQTRSVDETMVSVDFLLEVAEGLQAVISAQLDGLATLCPNLGGCAIFDTLCCEEYGDRYLEGYCLGDYPDCARLRLRNTGAGVPDSLLPDGSTQLGRQ